MTDMRSAPLDLARFGGWLLRPGGGHGGTGSAVAWDPDDLFRHNQDIPPAP
jgi:hypothetical protein